MGIAAPVICVRAATNGRASGQNSCRDSLWQIFQSEKQNMKYRRRRGTVCVIVRTNAAAWLQGIVCSNQVHVHRIETSPRGQRYLAIMYYNGLHLGMQFIKPSRGTFSYSSHWFSLQNVLQEVKFESLSASSCVFFPFPGCDRIVYRITIPLHPPEVPAPLHLLTLERGASQHTLAAKKTTHCSQAGGNHTLK